MLPGLPTEETLSFAQKNILEVLTNSIVGMSANSHQTGPGNQHPTNSGTATVPLRHNRTHTVRRGIGGPPRLGRTVLRRVTWREGGSGSVHGWQRDERYSYTCRYTRERPYGYRAFIHP